MANYSNTRKYLITLTVMLVAIIEVLDMTIVNVALPPMMGNLGANSEEITWVLTSYIVSAAIFMPLTGVLIERLGQKRLLLLNIVGFLISSMLCGIANNLTAMIFYRTCQGIFGASLVPLSQFILRNTYSKEELGKAMAIWGMGIMAAPVLGPTLGGYITQSLNWRWVFYINLPVCLIALFLTFSVIEETKRIQKDIDWTGALLMALGIGSLQIFLDQGNSKDWFESNLICALFFSFIVFTTIFIKRGLNNDNNIINLHLFKDRQFSISTLMILLYTATLLGTISIQPMMLENLMHYPIKTSGILMAPRGVASAIAMACVAQMINKYPAQRIIFIGLLFSVLGTYLMTMFELQSPMLTIMAVGVVQGIGMGLFFVPLSTLAFKTLPKQQEGEAAGIFSFGRSLGSSIGISIMSTVISQQTQVNWHQLGSHITPYNPNLYTYLAFQHKTQLDSHSLQQLVATLYRQANFNAFIDTYLLACFSFVILIPLVFKFKSKSLN